MKINNNQLVGRWDSVMNDICCEYLTIQSNLSELEDKKQYYEVENGITVGWMKKEAEYWLSCYYEVGNVRCDDKQEDYSTWVSETGKLKRLIARLEALESDYIVVEW